MDIIHGKKLATIGAEEFRVLRARFAECWVDVGSGDGLYVYHAARANPRVLLIGLEPAWRNASSVASRALRKSDKGGAANALFVRAALEEPPAELRAAAARLSVNYPWGSLLRAALGLESELLANLAGLAQPAALLDVVLNLSALEDRSDSALGDIPQFDQSFIESRLIPAYKAVGFDFLGAERSSAAAVVRSSWGGRLSRGSGRASLALRFRALGTCR